MDLFYCALLLPVVAPLAALGLLKLYLSLRVRRRHQQDRESADCSIVHVAFFHPYCHAGGGGERVLWCSIKALMERYRFVRCHVYTGDEATRDEILRRARQRFNVKIDSSVEFVHLRMRSWVEASSWPYFTLLGQSLGSVLLGMEAMLKFNPDVYIDSMGYAFTLPLFRWLGGCRIGCYVHYPTISTDMLERVGQRQVAFNNASFIAKSGILSQGKLWYYRCFAYLYGAAGRRSDIVMVNSSWTRNHIASLWQSCRVVVVYPPCDTSGFSANPLYRLPDRSTNKHLIVSVAQFRPEKNHILQLRAFALLKKRLGKQVTQAELVLVGGCRNDGDLQRVETLKKLAEELDIASSVRFELNASYDLLKEFLCSATIGLHTMVDEHFGIGVVECMAAGAVTLANNSAGPRMDIVVEWQSKMTGYLASTVEEYTDRMHEIIAMPDEQRNEIRQHARQSAARFNDEEFSDRFIAETEQLFRS